MFKLVSICLIYFENNTFIIITLFETYFLYYALKNKLLQNRNWSVSPLLSVDIKSFNQLKGLLANWIACINRMIMLWVCMVTGTVVRPIKPGLSIGNGNAPRRGGGRCTASRPLVVRFLRDCETFLWIEQDIFTLCCVIVAYKYICHVCFHQTYQYSKNIISKSYNRDVI